METVARPLPRRQLPPLDSPATPSESAGVEVPQTQTSEQRPKRRQRRRKPARDQSQEVSQVISNGNAITNILSDEDVVPVDKIDDMVSMTTLPGVAKHNGTSLPQDKVYVQTNSGFTSHTKDWLEARQVSTAKTMQDNADQIVVQRSSEVALSFHRGFLFFTLLLHGILGGLAVWEVVVAFILNAQGSTEFMRLYESIAFPLQTAFYIGTVLCFISAMDRFNFAKYGRDFFSKLFHIDGKAWMVLMYFISMMFNIGLTGLDQWLATANTPANSTLTSAFLTADLNNSITKWHAINVIRALFAVIGWAMIALHPEADNTSHGEVFSALD